MKRIFYLIIICSAIFSCNSEKKVIFKHYELVDYKQRERKLFLQIPKGYQYRGIKADAEAGMEQQYWYQDSSVIYITDFGGTINEIKIRNQENVYSRRFMADTASFWGIDEKGNYWKEVKYGKILYGYANVPSREKDVFDKVLNTVKYK